jgi:hypothetical protein
MFNFGRRIIRVTFIEEDSKRIISTVRMPLERLPATFAPEQQLKMAGKTYVVLRADPPNKPAFAGTKDLKVFVRQTVQQSET